MDRVVIITSDPGGKSFDQISVNCNLSDKISLGSDFLQCLEEEFRSALLKITLVFSRLEPVSLGNHIYMKNYC